MDDDHPIFDDIRSGNLTAVQTHVRADPAVLEKRHLSYTPLMWAIRERKTAIALHLIEHRGPHDLDTGDNDQWTAVHWACVKGLPEVVQALVAAGASTTKTDNDGWTPLMLAALRNHPDVVAFLLSLPAVLDSIDALDDDNNSALSYASCRGNEAVVRLLLDAGADPAIPAGLDSPLAQALENGHHAIAALLRQAIDHRRVAHAMLKARVLIEASQQQQQQQQPHVPMPACLQGRVARNQPLPHVAINDDEQQNEEAAATLRFVLGLQGHGGWAGAEDERATMRAEGLFPEVFVELLEYLLPAAVAWAGMQ